VVEPAPIVTPPPAAAERPNPYAPAATAPTVAAAAPANPYSTMPAGPSSTLSVLALVFGVLGLVLSLMAFGLLPAIAAVVLGHIALKREPHARGMGIAGLVTGYVGIGVSLLWGLVFIVPALLFFGTISGLGSGL
jgi:thiol:disulfide interchange protein